MGKVTFVVEFEPGGEPKVSSSMQVLGGKLCSVLWEDYRDDLLTEAELEIVEASLADSPTFEDICAERGISEVIISKLRLLQN